MKGGGLRKVSMVLAAKALRGHEHLSLERSLSRQNSDLSSWLRGRLRNSSSSGAELHSGRPHSNSSVRPRNNSSTTVLDSVLTNLQNLRKRSTSLEEVGKKRTSQRSSSLESVCNHDVWSKHRSTKQPSAAVDDVVFGLSDDEAAFGLPDDESESECGSGTHQLPPAHAPATQDSCQSSRCDSSFYELSEDEDVIMPTPRTSANATAPLPRVSPREAIAPMPSLSDRTICSSTSTQPSPGCAEGLIFVRKQGSASPVAMSPRFVPCGASASRGRAVIDSANPSITFALAERSDVTLTLPAYQAADSQPPADSSSRMALVTFADQGPARKLPSAPPVSASLSSSSTCSGRGTPRTTASSWLEKTLDSPSLTSNDSDTELEI